MVLLILKVLLIFALLPVVLFTLGVSFLMNDISLMNPFEWVTAARFAALVWIMAIACCVFGALEEGHITLKENK